MIEGKGPRAYWTGGGERRRYAPAEAGRGEAGVVPAAGRAACPPVILDSSPDDSGIGVWILVDAGNDYCEYEYGGGIA